jgi:hypothetical protein
MTPPNALEGGVALPIPPIMGGGPYGPAPGPGAGGEAIWEGGRGVLPIAPGGLS